MKKFLAVILLAVGSAHAAIDMPAWHDKNRDSNVSSKKEVRPLRGAESAQSSYSLGWCAASIAIVQPVVAMRLIEEAKARGEREQFYAGADAYNDWVKRDPIPAWQKARIACTGYALDDIKFKSKGN